MRTLRMAAALAALLWAGAVPLAALLWAGAVRAEPFPNWDINRAALEDTLDFLKGVQREPDTVYHKAILKAGREGRCCMDIDPGEGAPSPSDFKKLCAGGGRSWAVRRSTYG